MDPTWQPFSSHRGATNSVATNTIASADEQRVSRTTVEPPSVIVLMERCTPGSAVVEGGRPDAEELVAVV